MKNLTFIYVAICLVFISLKIFSLITYPWFIVLAPATIPVVIGLVATILVVLHKP